LDANRVTLFVTNTWLVETVKVVLSAPAGTVILLGTGATFGSLDARATTTPPAGAAALRVTVAWVALPPITDDGLTTNLLTVAGSTFRVALAAKPRSLTEMVTCVEAATGLVDTVKLTLVAPAGSVTVVGGTAAVGSLLETVRVAP
jgi:hypothetical protein